MKKLLSAAARPRILLILFILFAALYYLLAASPFSFSDQSFKQLTGSQTLDLKQWYTAGEAQALLNNLGAKGQSAYKTFHILDALLFIPVATLFFAGMLFSLYGKSGSKWISYLFLIQIITGVCDMLENVLIEASIARLPGSSASLLSVSSFVSAVKSVTWALSALLIVIGFAVWIKRKVKKS
jgi:hypothetical protein